MGTSHECYPCDFCDELLYDASQWYQHRAKHTMLACVSCEMIFYNKSALVKHRSEHMRYLCSVCNQEYKDYNKWCSHRAVHSETPKSLAHPLYVCIVCSKASKTQEGYYRHDCSYNRKNSIGNQLAIQHKLVEKQKQG